MSAGEARSAASICPECGNDPVAFMHEKNCSRLEVPESDPSLEARVLRLEKWAADTARWSDAIVERIEAQ